MATNPQDIILTTGFSVAQCEIERELDVITAECAYGMNFIKDIFNSVRDVVGGRSESTQEVLQDARREVLAELRQYASNLGADAVIGIDLDYHEMTGGGKSGMILVVASGTAVKTQRTKGYKSSLDPHS